MMLSIFSYIPKEAQVTAGKNYEQPKVNVSTVLSETKAQSIHRQLNQTGP